MRRLLYFAGFRAKRERRIALPELDPAPNSIRPPALQFLLASAPRLDGRRGRKIVSLCDFGSFPRPFHRVRRQKIDSARPVMLLISSRRNAKFMPRKSA